ncbi:unnamed protein product [Rotaria sp. Silwood2]|nr:unnamed protein product [Rotaria sp. Silwood2]CAF3264629.1 unnamed protein product [Rotaria sp. Silwood2]CAF3895330.1 unnamed protein product [Rotaria sp. Silwood2]CAF4264953.1 unnamed protein product [Rotaria sp. Silwood2]
MLGGYGLVDDKFKNQEWVSPSLNTFADGALYLNIYEIVKWETGLNIKKILKDKASFDPMWSPDETVSGMHVVKHGGTWQGFESYIIRVLDVKVTVVIFANADVADVEEIASNVLEMFDSQLALKSDENE